MSMPSLPFSPANDSSAPVSGDNGAGLILLDSVVSAQSLQYRRDGDDLVVELWDRSWRVEEYFSHPQPPSLATLSGERVEPATVWSELKQEHWLLADNGKDRNTGKPVIIGTATVIIEGPVHAEQGGSVRTLKEGDPVYLHDTITTTARSYIKITLQDGTVFQLGPLSRASLDKFSYQPAKGEGELEGEVSQGHFRFISGGISEDNQGPHTTIQTPAVTIKVRGSEFDAEIRQDGGITVLHSQGVIEISRRGEQLPGERDFTLFQPDTLFYLGAEAEARPSLHPVSREWAETFRERLEPLNQARHEESGIAPVLSATESGHQETGMERDSETSPDNDNGAISSNAVIAGQVGEEIAQPDNPAWRAPLADAPAEETSSPPSTGSDLPPVISSDPPDSWFPLPPLVAPPEFPDVLEINEDRAVLLASPPGTEGAEVVSVSDGAHGRVFLNRDGSLSYVPDPGFVGRDHFEYALSHGETGRISLEVPESPLPGSVEFLPPARGRILETAQGPLYQPEENYFGEQRLNYRDAWGQIHEIRLVVHPINDAPEAAPLNAEIREDESLVWSAEQILAQARDVEQDGLSLLAIFGLNEYDAQGNRLAGPVRGELVFDGGEAGPRYQPAENFYGRAEFFYTLADTGGALSAPAPVSITITPVNDAPRPLQANLVFEADAEGRLAIARQTLLDNLTDVEHDPLELLAVEQARGGEAVLNESGVVFRLDPATGKDGSFVYRVGDGAGGETEVTVSVNRHPADPPPPPSNRPPVAVNDSLSVAHELTPLDVDHSVLLANDHDPDSDSLHLIAVNSPINGKVVLSADQRIIFTPDPEFLDQGGGFRYLIDDGRGGRAEALARLVLENRAPLAGDDSYMLSLAQPAIFSQTHLLANDRDPDGDALTIVRVGEAVNGELSRLADQQWLFTPGPAFMEQGGGGFVYRISDGRGGEAGARVFLSAPLAPEPRDDQIILTGAMPARISADTLLANDDSPGGSELRIEAVGEAVNGEVRLEPSGEIVFTPADDFQRPNPGSFTYTVINAEGVTARAEVVLRRENAPPEPQADHYTLPLNQTSRFQVADLLANDSDPDGDSPRFLGAGQAVNGELSLSADGKQILFTPSPAFASENGGGFRYTVGDGRGGSAEAVVYLSPPATPRALDDEFILGSDWPALIPARVLLSNDSDPSGGTLRLENVDQAKNGYVSRDVDGNVIFLPDSNFYLKGWGEFEYSLSSSNGGLAQATVYLRWENTPPEAVDDEFILPVDRSSVISVADLLANDSDANGDPLEFVAADRPGAGLLILSSDGEQLLFTPDSDFAARGGTSFVYTISDGRSGSARGEVHLKSPDAPVAVDDELTLGNITWPARIAVAELLANDWDPNGNPLSITGVNAGINGTVSLDDSGVVSFQPDQQFYLSSRGGFEYTLTNNGGVSDQASVVLHWENSVPLAMEDSYTLPLGQTTRLLIADLLANDSDPDQDALHFVEAGNPVHGELSISPEGEAILFSPDDGFAANGGGFEYVINDGRGGNAVARVVLSAPPVPEVRDDEFILKAPWPGSIEVAELLANDASPDNSTLSLVSVGDAVNGEVSLDGQGNVIFEPDSQFHLDGRGEFQYLAQNLGGNSARATVVLIRENSPPEARSDAYTLPLNQTSSISISELLANDSDPDGDNLEFVRAEQATHGQLDISGDSLLFTPDADFAARGGGDFVYFIQDGHGGGDSARVSLAAPDAPLAVDDEFTVGGPWPARISQDSLLNNDSDPSGLSLKIIEVSAGLNSEVSLNASGNISFTPAGDFYDSGLAKFDYTVQNNQGASAVAEVVLTWLNSAPEAVADHYQLPANQASEIPVSELLANDTDADGNTLIFLDVTQVVNGSVSLVSSDTLLFTPDPEFARLGGGSFVYSVSDGYGGEGQAEVTLSAPQAPLPLPDVFRLNSHIDPTLIPSGELLLNDSDPDGLDISLVAVDAPVNGEVVLDSTGDVWFYPNQEFQLTGLGGFQYSVENSGGMRASAEVEVYRLGVGDVFSIYYNQPVAISVDSLLNNDPGTDLRMMGIRDLSPGLNLQWVGDYLEGEMDALGSGHFQPATFTYDVADASGREDSAQVILTPENVLLGSNGADKLEAPGIHPLEITLGLDGNDQLVGGKSPDILFGGSGLDRLEVGAGDAAFGEAGDDQLVFNPLAVPVLLDGGEGVDTVVPRDGYSLDFTHNRAQPADKQMQLKNIEIIELTPPAGSGAKIVLEAQDVLDMTSDGWLTILGDKNTEVISTGGTWDDHGSLMVNGLEYHHYSQGSANLLVEPEIGLSI